MKSAIINVPRCIHIRHLTKALGGALMTKSIPLTRGKFALVDDEDFDFINQFKWFAHESKGKSYAERKLRNVHVKLHRVLLNAPPDKEVDHINGDGLDCRRENLRLCNHKQNTQNARLRKDNTSGYKGVSSTVEGRWRAHIRGNKVFIGCFGTPEEAARAYDKKAIELFGEFAKLNFRSL